jgi:hypothetical protein
VAGGRQAAGHGGPHRVGAKNSKASGEWWRGDKKAGGGAQAQCSTPLHYGRGGAGTRSRGGASRGDAVQRVGSSPVRLNLSAWLISHGTIFFSHNKSANSTFRKTTTIREECESNDFLFIFLDG